MDELIRHSSNNILIFISPFLDNHRGYIQNLSPIKRSRNQNQWFEFDLQTSPSKLRRVTLQPTPHYKNMKHQKQL